jgi:hypothetical protein
LPPGVGREDEEELEDEEEEAEEDMRTMGANM